jgi:hypothetical protein
MTENWCSYSDLFSKTTLNICKFPLHFLQCKAKFSADGLFFEICMFQNFKWATCLSLRTHYSIFTRAAALLKVGNNPAASTVSTSAGRIHSAISNVISYSV